MTLDKKSLNLEKKTEEENLELNSPLGKVLERYELKTSQTEKKCEEKNLGH